MFIKTTLLNILMFIMDFSGFTLLIVSTVEQKFVSLF